MVTKTIGEFEKQKNCILIGADPKKKVTEEEFDSYPAQKWGVMHDDRIEFLKANRYEVTRQNMVDPNLSSRTDEEINQAEQPK